MAEHRWSILCHRGCIDRYSNILSLLDVTDELEIQLKADTLPENPLLPTKLQLISMWRRTEPERPEKAWLGITIVAPNEETFFTGELTEVDLESYLRARLLLEIPTLPYRGGGTYWFCVGVTSNPEGDSLVIADRVPLEVKVKPSVTAENASTSPGLPSGHSPAAPPPSSSPPSPSLPSPRRASPKRRRRGS